MLRALVRIKSVCFQVQSLRLFYFKEEPMVKLEEYRQQQDHQIHKSVNLIRNWSGEVIQIILAELRFAGKKSAVLSGDVLDRFF